MAKTKSIKLADLLVNTDNYRFDPVDGQREAIDRMIVDQGDKLLNLADHILTHGLNPSDPVQVAPSNHDTSKFNVVEGNRRVVTLKLLNQPDLLDGHSVALKRKFKKLHDDNKSGLLKRVPCTVYDDPKEADIWIGVKHGYGKSGVSTDGWDPIQKGRFEEQVEGKSSIVVQAVNFLKSSAKVSQSIKDDLGKLKVSSLQRLINDPEIREFAGLSIQDGKIRAVREESEVAKVLEQIAKDLLNPKFKVSRIYTKQDRSDYVDSFAKSATPDTTKVTQPWDLGGSPPKALPVNRVRTINKERDSVIPRSCVLSIKIPKINSIYHELQKLSVTKFTNSAAMTLRAFVEFSMDAYIEGHGLTAGKGGGALNEGSRLIRKISEVANDMEGKKLADDKICKGIRTAAADRNDLLGIETLHAYVHNPKYAAIPRNLVISWDNIQPFMERLWGSL